MNTSLQHATLQHATLQHATLQHATLCKKNDKGILQCTKDSHPTYFHCYECGDIPAYHISVMQDHDCSKCGGRRCHMHGGDYTDDEGLCIDCSVIEKL
uniref:Uncharacterized protein n=1 Tax=viral metagenome TaxID=1070528 RepID=A0A6C0LYZ9_9ZZZZ